MVVMRVKCDLGLNPGFTSECTQIQASHVNASSVSPSVKWRYTNGISCTNTLRTDEEETGSTCEPTCPSTQ